MANEDAIEKAKRLENARYINYWRVSSSSRFLTLVDLVSAEFEQKGILQRKLDGSFFNWSQQRQQCLSAVLADLFSVMYQNPTKYLAFSRDNGCYKKSRYRPSFIGYKPFIAVIDGLRGCGFLEFEKGYKHLTDPSKSELSKMRASKKLIKYFHQSGIEIKMISRDPFEEVIIVNDENGRPMEYVDSIVTPYERECIRAYNSFLGQHEFRFDFTRDEYASLKPQIDLTGIRMRRVYSRGTRTFSLGGRLFSDCWTNMPKDLRKKIRINGEPVTELDYKALHTTMCYLLRNKPVPTGDMYLLPGCYQDKVSRKFIKRLTNIMINAKSIDSACKGIHECCCKPKLTTLRETGNVEVKTKKPDWLQKTNKACLLPVISDIKKQHAPIDCYFFSDMGVYLQWRESEIAMGVILTLLNRGVVALPEHDSFIVPIAHEKILKETMKWAFKAAMDEDYDIEVNKRY